MGKKSKKGVTVEDGSEIEDQIIILLGEKEPLAANEIYQKIQKNHSKISKVIIWARLTHLVEKGYIEIFEDTDNKNVTKFIIKK